MNALFQIAINKTQTHYEVIEEHMDFSSFGFRFYSVFDGLNSTDAVVTVLPEDDPRKHLLGLLPTKVDRQLVQIPLYFKL